MKETIALLTVLFTDLFCLNQPKLSPSPGRRAGQTYASADDPSASWHRVRGAVMHKKAGPHLLTLKMAVISVTHSSSHVLQLSRGTVGLLFDLSLCRAAISLPRD